jgi:hypothetical protein
VTLVCITAFESVALCGGLFFGEISLQRTKDHLETPGSNWILKDKRLTFEPVAPCISVKKCRKIAIWRDTVKLVRTYCSTATEVDKIRMQTVARLLSEGQLFCAPESQRASDVGSHYA